MFEEKSILIFYAETPVHMGAGQAVSYVDLPIQRERHTNFPVLWSSGIKGVIREFAERRWKSKEKVNTIFGPEDGSEQYASCISITDAKILLYPVRSVRGIFAWISCPLVLKKFKEDLRSVGIKNEFFQDLIPSTDGNVIISTDSVLNIKEEKDKNVVALEEFIFSVESGKNADSLANFIKKFMPDNPFINNLSKHIAVVSDNTFKYFVSYAVEIRTRIKINQTTGTVEEKALFSEEFIPSESIFYSLVFIADPYLGLDKEIYDKLKNKKEKQFDNAYNNLNNDEKNKVNKNKERIERAYNGNYFTAKEIKESLKSILDNALIQLGGDETIGKGFMKIKFHNGGKDDANN